MVRSDSLISPNTITFLNVAVAFSLERHELVMRDDDPQANTTNSKIMAAYLGIVNIFPM